MSERLPDNFHELSFDEQQELLWADISRKAEEARRIHAEFVKKHEEERRRLRMLTIKIQSPAKDRYWAKEVKSIDTKQRGAYTLNGQYLVKSEAKEEFDGKSEWFVNFRAKLPEFSIVAVGQNDTRHTHRYCCLIETQDGVSDTIQDGHTIEGGRILFYATDKNIDANIGKVAEWGADNREMKEAKNSNYVAALYLKYKYWKETSQQEMQVARAQDRQVEAIRFSDPAAIEIEEVDPGEVAVGQETIDIIPQPSSPAQLTVQEREEFEHHEQTIRRGLNTFFDVGIALGYIREKRLYRENYDTFENYCQERWEMSKTHANRFIASANVVKALKETPVIPEESSQPEEPSQSKMTPIGVKPERDTQLMPPILPENEAQVRPLTKLEPEKQQEAWKQVIEAVRKGAKLTAALVEESVKELLKQKEKPNISCEQCGAALPNKPLVELIDAESGKFLCEECKAKRPKPQGKTFEVEVQQWGNLTEVEKETRPVAIAATIEELEKILADEWFYIENDQEAAIKSLRAIKDKTPSGKHVLSNIYNQLKDDGRILPGQKHDVRQACWNLLEWLQAEGQSTRDFGNCALCQKPLAGPGNFGRHPDGAICDACLAIDLQDKAEETDPLALEPGWEPGHIDFSFYQEDRNKVMKTGLRLFRVSIHHKEIKEYTPIKKTGYAGKGTWKLHGHYDTKKTIEEEITRLRKEENCIFESHTCQVEVPEIKPEWSDLSDEELKHIVKMAKRELTQRHRPSQEGDPGAQYQDSTIPDYLLQAETSASPEIEIAADMPAASPEVKMVQEETKEEKPSFQLEPPTIKELCSNCGFHKMKNSSTPGKLLAPHYHGKCTREGGFCDEVRGLMETPTLPEEPTPAQEKKQADIDYAFQQEEEAGQELLEQIRTEKEQAQTSIMQEAARETTVKVQLLQDILVGKEHGMTEGLELEVLRRAQDGFWVKSPSTGEDVKLHENEFTVIQGKLDDVPSTDHTWRKRNLVTKKDKTGMYDAYTCEKCGITARRYGLGSIRRDKKFSDLYFDDCHPEEEITAYIMKLKGEEGMTVRSIAQKLKEQGMMNPGTGKSWSKSAIDRVIQATRKEGRL